MSLLAAMVVAALCVADLASAAPRIPRREPDVFGGYSSSQIVVRLKPEAHNHPAMQKRRQTAGRTADPQPALSAAFRTKATQWGVRHIRPQYSGEFRNPQRAAHYGLDRVYVIEVPPGTDTPAMAAAFAALKDVESATVDTIGGVADVIPDDTFFHVQYAMHNTGQEAALCSGGSRQGQPCSINSQCPGGTCSGQNGTPDADIDAPAAWELHTGDPGTVTIAIIDSGVNGHVEFGSRLLPGINTVAVPYSTFTSDGCPHGTHVAGIAAAGGNNHLCSAGSINVGQPCVSDADCQRACVGGFNSGAACDGDEKCRVCVGGANPGTLCLSNEQCLGGGTCPAGGTCATPSCNIITGVAGVSWGANILPVRVLTGCSGFATDLKEGIIWAVDVGHADVANISLQFYNLTPTEYNDLQDAINYAHDEGMILVAAAGNGNFGGAGVVAFPARMANCMGVSATTSADLFADLTTTSPAWRSNYGNEIDVAAPGDDIYSTWTGNGYTFSFGTSMATPHVSGLAALIKSYVLELTNWDIELIIDTTADDLGTEGWDNKFGFGRINAHSALLAADTWRGMILSSSPPRGAIDARKPMDPDGTNAYGWQSVDFTFSVYALLQTEDDFLVEGEVAAPLIAGVTAADDQTATLTLKSIIETRAWTTFTHLASGTSVRLGYLPGDVNSDEVSDEDDLTLLSGILDGTSPARAIWSMDMDRTETVTGADLLELADLLNGAGEYDTYLGATLP